MVQQWKLPSSRKIDIDNIPAAFSSLYQLSSMPIRATMAMLYGDSLSDAMTSEEDALYDGGMLSDIEIDRENALEKTKYQIENPNAILTPWGPSLSPEEIDIMLQENEGLESLLGVPESQHAALMAEADMIMDQMSDELDDVLDVADDMGMRENTSPLDAAKNIAGDALLNTVDFLFPPDTAYASESGMTDQTDQILDGVPTSQRPSVPDDQGGPGFWENVKSYPSQIWNDPQNFWNTTAEASTNAEEEAMLAGDTFLGGLGGEIGSRMEGQPLSFPEAMALGATGDPSAGRGDPMTDEELQGLMDTQAAMPAAPIDSEIANMLDDLLANTSDNPQDFLEEVYQLTQPAPDPDNPGGTIGAAITPSELQSWIGGKDIRYGHPLMSIMPELYGSTRPQGTRGVGAGTADTGLDTVPPSGTAGTAGSQIRGALTAKQLTTDENLLKPFYETMNKLEDAGRPDVRAAMPQIQKDTLALFWFWEGDKVHKVDPNPTELEEQYGAFLEKYVKDPRSFRGGKKFNDRIQWLGGLLEQEQQSTHTINPWVKARFIDNPVNTTVLSDLYRTGGSRDYYAKGIHSALGEMSKYWTAMGESNTDVFRRLTAPRTAPVTDKSQAVPTDEVDDILEPPGPVQAGWGSQAI